MHIDAILLAWAITREFAKELASVAAEIASSCWFLAKFLYKHAVENAKLRNRISADTVTQADASTGHTCLMHTYTLADSRHGRHQTFHFTASPVGKKVAEQSRTSSSQWPDGMPRWSWHGMDCDDGGSH